MSHAASSAERPPAEGEWGELIQRVDRIERNLAALLHKMAGQEHRIAELRGHRQATAPAAENALLERYGRARTPVVASPDRAGN